VSTELTTATEPAAIPPAATLAPPSLRVREVSKVFRLPHRRFHTLKERVLHPVQARSGDRLHALDDVSFEVARGEFFGIVGRNGSGKSTLLKCMAGIYRVDHGSIEVRGRLSPFIELGVGFNTELSARDNVLINGIMLGLSRRQAEERFDDIIAFAELEEFIDLPLKNYSSGMSVRLAFSVAIQVDADILLVDEVLAVGDAAFQQKCFEQFQALKDAGRTIVFVTHDMSSVERFCDRAVLIERGRIQTIGGPEEVARAYNHLNFGRLPHEVEEGEREGEQKAEITAAWFEDNGLQGVTALPQGEFCHIRFEVRFHEDMTDPIFSFALRDEAHHVVIASSTRWDHPHTGAFRAGETVRIRFGFFMRLTASRYTLSPSVSAAGTGEDVLDRRDDLAVLLVHSSRRTGGVVDPEQVIELERVTP
jgi:ABC-type polysaccharide/polyol phosphate transport system ATPase subunit